MLDYDYDAAMLLTVSNNSVNIGHCMSMKLNTDNMQRIQFVYNC